MIMKFKTGDKVRCVKPTSAVGVKVGGVYTIRGVSHKSQFGIHVALSEVLSTPTTDVFELVQEDAVLTPEEVFEHLRKGTQLQVRDCGWQDKDRHSTTFSEIIHCKWRVKPEPEVIELNGKKYREIVD